MTLTDIIKLLPKANWISGIQKIEPVLGDLSIGDQKSICKEILDKLENFKTKSKAGKIIDYTLLGLKINKNYFLLRLQKGGFLRHSSYMRKNPLWSLLNLLREHQAFFELTTDEVRYVASLVNLRKLYDDVIIEYEFVNTEIRRLSRKEKSARGFNRKSTIKTLLNYNELNFLTNRERAENHDLDSLSHYNKEEISEAISFIVSTWDEVVGLDGYDFHPINYDFYKSERLTRLIVAACHYLLFKELEIDIERFGYRAIIEDDLVTLIPPDDDFGKTRELSMIISSQQAIADNLRLRTKYKDVPSIDELTESFHKTFEQAFRLETFPFRRYRLEIPEPLFDHLKITEGDLFKEDMLLVESIEKDLLLPFDEFERFLVGDKMTFHTFLSLYRVFYALHYLIKEKLLSKLKVEEETVLNSLCPVFKQEVLESLLSKLVNEDVAQEFLNAFTWEAESNGYLDLQYQPVVFIDGYYGVCLSVFAGSRMSRNIFRSQAKKNRMLTSNKNIGYDKLVAGTVSVLEVSGFQVWTEQPVKFITQERRESDIDILAIKDGLVLIIECKDSITPVGAFELRTSYDAVQKAVQQLRHSSAALNDEMFRKTFSKNRNIDLSETTKISSMILTSNREFWGYEFQSFPIRSIHEFSNFLTGGEFSIRMPGDIVTEVYRLWKGNKLTNDDLLWYLSKDGPHRFFFDAMKKYYLTYKNIFKIQRFALVINDVQEELRKSIKVNINKDKSDHSAS